MTDEELIEEFNKSFVYKDGNLFWKIKPNKSVRLGDSIGCANGKGYLVVRLNRKLYTVHRVIFSMFNGYFPEYVDHIDGNPLNNKVTNLRECNAAENGWNSKLSSKNTSGVKGVSFDRTSKKWRARLCTNRANTHLGLYPTIKEAEVAVIKARSERHREFARHS